MGGQLHVIRDNRLHADAGDAQINPEAAIRYYNGIFRSKCQLPQVASPAPQVVAFLQGGGLCQEGCGKKWRAPGQNVRGLGGNVQPPGRGIELGIDVGRFNVRRGRWRAPSASRTRRSYTRRMPPLSNKTLRGWKVNFVILGSGVEGLCPLSPDRVAFRLVERFITACFPRSGALLLFGTQSLPPCKGL